MKVNKVCYNIDQRAETTENDKARARANIGAAAVSEVPFTYTQRFADTVTLEADDISSGHFDLNFEFANVVSITVNAYLVSEHDLS